MTTPSHNCNNSNNNIDNNKNRLIVNARFSQWAEFVNQWSDGSGYCALDDGTLVMVSRHPQRWSPKGELLNGYEGLRWPTVMIQWDDDMIVAGTDDGQLCEWSVSGGELIGEIPIGDGRVNHLLRLGHNLLLVVVDSQILLFSVQTKFRFVHSFEIEDKDDDDDGDSDPRVVFKVVALDSQHFVSHEGSDEQALYVWNVTRRTYLKRVVLGYGNLRVYPLLSKKWTVAVCEDYSDIQIWDLSTSKLVTKLKGHSEYVVVAELYQERLLLSGDSNGTLKVWNCGTVSGDDDDDDDNDHSDNYDCLATYEKVLGMTKIIPLKGEDHQVAFISYCKEGDNDKRLVEVRIIKR